MRRRTVGFFGFVSLAALAVEAKTCNKHNQQQQRHITTRGQFNPVHDFTYAIERGVRAKDEKSFEKLITNPGPLRIAYTPDYLDWLYRSYKAKVKYMDARAAAENKFNGNLISSGGVETTRTTGGEGSDQLPGAPPPGRFLRPPHSFRRLAGEMKRRRAQETLDEISKAQGMLDLFERQPHFPAIHIDSCTRFHLVELFKEFVLERALNSTEIWDKALMYRAILSERKSSYPPSFRYIFKAVDETVFAPSSPNSPTVQDYYYFLYLTKKYYIDNGVTAHVVLRCHREPNAAELLFSNPPPKDDEEVRRSIDAILSASSCDDNSALADLSSTVNFEAANINKDSNKSNSNDNTNDNNANSGDRKVSTSTKGKSSTSFLPPKSYPPIDMFWRCEENVPLLKILLFAEFNIVVSENPFVKFPSAHAFLTRPYSTDIALNSMDSVSLANVIAEKRGHLLPPFPRNVSLTIDSRAQDLRRLQQRHHRDDIVTFQKFLRSTEVEDNPSTFSSYSDWSYFNPRAVRAEERDRLTRKGINALKEYDAATDDIYRRSFEDVQATNSQRVTERWDALPSSLPTLPHFVSIIKKDPHISFLLHVGLPERDSDATAAAKHNDLERRVYHLARALYQMAFDFHKEAVRRVNRQKVNVTASHLDSFLEKEWAEILRESQASQCDIMRDERADMMRRLGRYKPFASRPLDDSGFYTDARAEDYTRWMAAPAALKADA